MSIFSKWQRNRKLHWIAMQTIRAITYLREDVNHHQTPAETLALGTGDCEDICMLIWQRWRDAGLVSSGEVQMLLLTPVDTTQEDHAVLKIGDKYCDNIRGMRAKPTGYFVQSRMDVENWVGLLNQPPEQAVV